MIRDDFTTKSLLRVTTINEIIKFNLGRGEGDYKESLDVISKEIGHKSFKISDLKKTLIGGKVVFSTSTASEHYALKKISKDINRVYKLDVSNRDDISEQLLRILESSSQYGFIRLDVKSFYESIYYCGLLEKLNREKLISVKSLRILSDLISEINDGLPRGLSISPVLSEIFMRDIDYAVKSIEGVYYYARYVDDIVIITTKKVDDIFKSVEDVFLRKGLDFNSKFYKRDVASINNSKEMFWFDYLGYKFKIKPSEKDGRRKILVGLSNDKIRKYKTRIVHSILDRALCKKDDKYSREIFSKRIQYLSGNYSLFSSSNREGSLKGGVYYSNKLVNDPGVFLEINSFLKKSLSSNSKNFFGRMVGKIPNEEKEHVKFFCFREGFLKRIECEFSEEIVVDIKSCWKNKKHKRSK